jgi:hypothetical protein
MLKPLALDLCCGKGGWSKGLLAAGWDVIGVDIEAWEGYSENTRRIITDVRTFSMLDYEPQKVSLVVASPPCQEFSYRSFPFKRCRELAANVPPDKTIWEACERIAKECNAPLVLENVRGAQKYMGKAKAHYGSFYLWGDVPALLPIGNPTKGFTHKRNLVGKAEGWKSGNQRLQEFAQNRDKKSFPGEGERVKSVNRFSDHPSAQMSSKSISRKQWSAQAAMIPFELSNWIGNCFYPK